MSLQQPGAPHVHMKLVATDRDAVPQSAPTMQAKSVATIGVSLLRLSLAVRLLIVACVSVLLWSAVFWALR